MRSDSTLHQAIREKLGLKERKTASDGHHGDGRVATTGKRQAGAASLFEAATDFLGGIVATVQSVARAVVDKVKEIGQRVQDFVQDIRENGLRPLFESVKQGAIDLATNPQRVTDAISRAVDRANSALVVVPERIRSVMVALNDRLYGINRKEGEAKSAGQQSGYWRDLTGMSKQQFLVALRKDRDRLLLLGSVSAKGIDFNAASRAAKQGEGSSSTGLAKIRVADLLRGNFDGVFELRAVLAQRIAQRLIEGPLLGGGKLTSFVFERALWLRELLAARQAALNQNIVEFHEAFISGTTFAEIYKENDSWKQRYFSPKGTGRSYSEMHEAY